MIDLNILSQATVAFMTNNQISSDEMLQSARRKSSPFAKICENIIGKYCFKTTTNFLSMWKRNQKGRFVKCYYFRLLFFHILRF